VQDTKLLGKALERLRRLQLTEAFDAYALDSRPNSTQLEYLKDINKVKIRLIRAGGQCLAEGTLVATPNGPVAIEDLRPGDTVYDKDGRPIEVVATHNNGPKEVAELIDITTSEVLAVCTAEHRFYTGTSCIKAKRIRGHRIAGLGYKTVASWGHNPHVVNTYDITVSSPDSLYLLANGLITHNSGKSSTIAREYAWVLTDTHPYWKRPEAWGTEPYLMLIAGQDRRMMEMELWGKKLKPFLDSIDGEGVWREVRSGNALQYVENRKKGYKIVFLSHSDSSESNRKHMQGYVAHFVWMDELSNNLSIIEELQRRVQAKNGWFSLSFTPKGKAESIRNWADNIKEPYGKVYRMGMLDNPIYATRMEELKARLEHMPEGMRNTVLFGEWEVGDSTVYQFEWSMVEAPENYNKGWRHVEANDPAMAGKSGFLLFAEDPTSGVWYAVREEYIEGHYSPDNLVDYVKQITAPYNIVRRVADGHEAWYIGMASKMGLTYQVPYKKNERKDELIKGLQHALTNGRMKIAPWCRSFIAELQSAQWAEGEGKARIVNRKNLHLQDAAQYFVDCAPKPESPVDDRPWWEVLREGNAARKKREKMRVSNKGRFLLTNKGTRRI
jgi:hypothetical protein